MQTEQAVDVYGAIEAIEPKQLPALISKQSISVEEMAWIEKIKQSNPLQSTAGVITYGENSQRRLSRYLDELLKDSAIGNTNVGSSIVAEIGRGIDNMHLERMRLEVEGKNYLALLPFIGKYFSAFYTFMIDRKAFVREFERIEAKGRREINSLIDTVSRFDGLVVELESLLRSHAVHLIAGQEILWDANKIYVQKREQILQLPVEDRDPVKVAQLLDYRQRIIQFETRLVNLHKDYLENVQSIPQIRFASKAAEMQMQAVMESLTSDLNRFKGAIVNLNGLNEIRKSRKSAKIQKANSHKMAEYSAQATQNAYLEGKDEQASIEDELAYLTKLAEILKETARKGAELDQKNLNVNREVSQKLSDMRNGLSEQIEGFKNKLTS